MAKISYEDCVKMVWYEENARFTVISQFIIAKTQTFALR